MDQNLTTEPLYGSERISPPDRIGKKPSTEAMTDDQKINLAAARILKEYRAAFEELAK